MATWSNPGFMGYLRSLLGDDNSNNDFSSASVAANADGSLIERLEYLQALAPATALKAAAVITNGLVLFTCSGGPVRIIALASLCITTNDGTASTLQYSITPTVGAAQTISGASASLASAAAGATVTLAGTALSTAALLNANGPNLIANPGTVLFPVGTLTAVVGVGSTTGTWRHYMTYEPLVSGASVA